MRNNKKIGLAGLAALAALSLALPAAAADSAAAPASKEDAAKIVVATVDGQPVTQGDMTAAFLQVGKQLQQQQVPADQMAQALIDYVIDTRLAAKAAAAAGYDTDPAVVSRLAVAHDAVLYSDFFQRKIAASVTEDAVKKKFDEDLAKFVASDEPHVFHILVKDEAEAKAIIAQLDQGSDFAAIAKEKSIDTGTASNGGDLGFVPRKMTVPEFEAAAYALKVGTYTEAPVQSQYGWHVIKVTETRKEPPPKFEQEQARIEGELVTAAVHDARVALRDGVEITYVKPPAPDGAQPDAPADGAAPAKP